MVSLLAHFGSSSVESQFVKADAFGICDCASFSSSCTCCCCVYKKICIFKIINKSIIIFKKFCKGYDIKTIG
jgi:hypothetical protein